MKTRKQLLVCVTLKLPNNWELMEFLQSFLFAVVQDSQLQCSVRRPPWGSGWTSRTPASPSWVEGGRWSWWWRGLEGSPARSSSWSGSCTPPRRTRWRTRPEQENLRTQFHNFSFLEQENLVWWKWKSLSHLVSKYGVKLAENIFGKSLNKNTHENL